MPLLGSAALLLSFDVAEEAISEHDDWHTHEHLAERLAIPGFLRGTRWVARRGTPRYMVLYEVADLAILSSAAYLERLNHPSAWTSSIMSHYRGMTRGLCSVAGSFGLGTGHAAALLRFKPAPEAAEALRGWLLRDALPDLPSRPGMGSVHLLEGAATPQMTSEQRIRGADKGVDCALLLTAYREEALAELIHQRVGPSHLEHRGAVGAIDAAYSFDYSLSRSEVDA